MAVRAIAIVLIANSANVFHAFAQTKSPYPQFDGRRLYVVGVENVYDSVQAEIERIETSSMQTYYIVVVRSRGEETGQPAITPMHFTNNGFAKPRSVG